MTENYDHNGKTYTIEIKDELMPTTSNDALWTVVVRNEQNKQIIKATVDDILLDHIQRTTGENQQDFLKTFAKSEINRLK